MFGKKQPEVLVSGAGPVGLCAALALTRRGVPVQIVDREWRRGTHSYALALHAESLGILERLGALEAVLEKAVRVRRVGLYDRSGRHGEVRVSDLAEDHSFVAVMRQADLEGLLEEQLKHAGVKVLWNHEAVAYTEQDDHVEVKLNKLAQDSVGYAVEHTVWFVSRSKKLEVPFVIGADGTRSTARRALGIDFPEVGEAQDFAVFEFATDADLGDELRLILDDDTTDVCWPLPDGYCRWGFQLPHDDQVRDEREKERQFGQIGTGRYPMLDERHLRALLAERAPWFEGSVETPRWRVRVRFQRRLADTFGRGRVWLAGDAGHTTGPAGVQSMNVGLREACDLADTIAKISKGDAPRSDLDEYGRARVAEWRWLLGLEGALEPGADADPWMSARSERLLSCLPSSGEGLRRLTGQLGLHS